MIPDPAAVELLESRYLDNKINGLKDSSDIFKGSKQKSDRKTIEEAAEKFEQIFLMYMMKTMRKTIDKSGLIDGGRGEEIYTSMLDNEFATTMSKSKSFGLSNLIVNDLISRGYLKGYEKNEVNGSLVVPVDGEISSSFGLRDDPIDGVERFHYGMDISAPFKSEIKASESGRVVFSDRKGGFGKMVVIEHEGGYSTIYAHNNKNLVQAGEYVQKGQTIATVGSSGRSTGPHVHFEVRKGGKSLNPAAFL